MLDDYQSDWDYDEHAGWRLQVALPRMTLLLSATEVEALQGTLRNALRYYRRLCGVCGDPFLCRYPTGAYCSSVCRTSAYRQRSGDATRPSGPPGDGAAREAGGP